MSKTPKKLLITGVAGFLGRYVAQLFKSNGWDVYGVDICSAENVSFLVPKNYVQLPLPSAKFDEVLSAHKPEAVVHCAGRASVPLSVKDPAADYAASATLTFHVLDAIRRCSESSKFIFLSSAAVYGNPVQMPVSEKCAIAPISPYGFHKYQAENIVLEFASIFKVKAASLRIFSAYGPGLQRQVVWDICSKALSSNDIKLQGTGAESRDLVHAADVAQAVYTVINHAPLNGEAYNVASGNEVTIRDLAEKILERVNREGRVTFDQAAPAGTPKNWRADIAKIQALGFRPSMSLDSGLDAVVAWVKSSGVI